MVIFRNDQLQFDSNSLEFKQESSSSSSSSSSADQNSDEEVILASAHPKKRAGRRVFKETRHPVFRGVRSRKGDKWVCEVREPNKKSRIWLGTYPSPEMAARAHDVAALALRGKSACLNFADSSWRLPVPVSSDAGDIRKAAREAAEMFRPEEFGGAARNEKPNVSEECSSELYSTFDDCRAHRNENAVYFDEDDVFDMPSLLADMAQGLLLSPGYQMDNSDWDGMDHNSVFSLWSY